MDDISKVNWGDKGCTEAGIFLERAKGAKEVGFVEKEVLVEEEDDENYEKLIEQNSCCEKLKVSLKIISKFF